MTDLPFIAIVYRAVKLRKTVLPLIFLHFPFPLETSQTLSLNFVNQKTAEKQKSKPKTVKKKKKRSSDKS